MILSILLPKSYRVSIALAAFLSTAVCLFTVRVGHTAEEPDQKEQAPEQSSYEPTSQYAAMEMEGWQLRVNRRLLEPDNQVGQNALGLLRIQLVQIKQLLPASRVNDLQTISIWLDDDPRNKIHYHPERQWLIDNNFNPDRAKAVDIGRADRLVAVYFDQPFVVLHELAHAFHDQYLGFDDPRVLRTFQYAKKSGDYGKVLKSSGGRGRHYALSNHKEYFAESTESFFGRNDFYPFVRAELQQHDPRMHRLLTEIWLADVQPVSNAVRDKFQLHASYTRFVDCHGLPVVGSRQVPEVALREAAWIVFRMLQNRPDLISSLVEKRVRLVVMDADEFTTDVPEHSDLQPAKYWDRRARGLGATRRRPAVSCATENLLHYPGDPYAGENILVHEFAHTVHQLGLVDVDADFAAKLSEAYANARDQGLWEDTYAITNEAEYWAEGVQSYFDCNRANDSQHNQIRTRARLRQYDPMLYDLIDSSFDANPWRYSPARQRSDTEHLREVDFDRLPTFQWPQAAGEQSGQ